MVTSRRPVSGPAGTPVTDEPGGTRRLDPAVSLPDAEVRADPPGDGPDADPEGVARAILLRRLAAAPRTQAQLADDLRRRNVPEDVASRVLARFAEVGLIDDEAYAQTWVRSRHSGRGLARRALAHELRSRGVDEQTVAEAVEEISPEDEQAAARALVARRLPSTRGLDRQARVRRLVGMLARKGYPSGLSLRVVKEALDADDGEAVADLGFLDPGVTQP